MRFIPLILLVLATPSMAETRAKELAFLTPIMSDTLAEHGNFQVPALENLDILTEHGEPFVELRMFAGQDMTLKGYRAEVTVDLPHNEGDTLIYEWRLRIPSDSETDPENRWWMLGQWHDQPDLRIDETWDDFPLKSPSILLGYGHIDGHDIVSMAYGAPDLIDTTYTELTRDVWHYMRVEIHWSMDDDGWAKMYMDDFETPFAQATGRNMHNAYQHFMKLGFYRHPDIQVNSRIQLDDISIEIVNE